jgi:hypothetical protein
VTKDRFVKALVAYAVLAAIGLWTLEGDIRLFLLIFLGGLVLKSYIALLRTRTEEGAKLQRENDRDGDSKP